MIFHRNAAFIKPIKYLLDVVKLSAPGKCWWSQAGSWQTDWYSWPVSSRFSLAYSLPAFVETAHVY